VASLKRDARAIGAVVARFVHTEEVTGSNPVSPTIEALVGGASCQAMEESVLGPPVARGARLIY
jgi:hypothetical protein